MNHSEDKVCEIIESYFNNTDGEALNLYDSILEFDSHNLNELFMSFNYIDKNLILKINDADNAINDIITNSPENISITKILGKSKIFFNKVKYVISINCSSNGYIKFLFTKNFVNKGGIRYKTFAPNGYKILGVYKNDQDVKKDHVEIGVCLNSYTNNCQDYWFSDKFLKEKKTNTLCFNINSGITEKLIKEFTEFCVLSMNTGASMIVQTCIKNYTDNNDPLYGTDYQDFNDYLRETICVIRYIDRFIRETSKKNILVFVEPGMIDLAYNSGGDYDDDVFTFYKGVSEFVKKETKFIKIGYGLIYSELNSDTSFGGINTPDYYTVYHDTKKYNDFLKLVLFPVNKEVNIGVSFEKEKNGIMKEINWKNRINCLKILVENLQDHFYKDAYVNMYFLNVSNGYPKETMEISRYTNKIFRQPREESSASLFFLGGKVDSSKLMKIYRDSFYIINNTKSGDTLLTKDKNNEDSVSINGCLDEDLYDSLYLRGVIFKVSENYTSSGKPREEDLYTIQKISEFSS